jgi:signal transduction histidine kinase
VPVALNAISTSRDRLARDLHDGVGQSINALLVQIRVALMRGEAGLDDLRVLEVEAQNALQSIRILAYGVRRRPASDPLEEARLYAERLLMGSGTTLVWMDERSGTRLSRKLARQLAWSLRESVTNAARYARAQTIEVRLSDFDNEVQVMIRDDGVGFSPEDVEPTADGRGLGLLGNAERMAEVGGFVEVRSSQGKGTVVLLGAPIAPRSAASGLFAAAEPVMAAAVSAIAPVGTSFGSLCPV